MANTNQDNSNSSRWWEFYAVRYGMGTVVGGVVFFFLCTANDALTPLLFGAKNGNVDGPLLTLLAGYGLAYCYIASAPILVLHAGRFLLDSGPNVKLSMCRGILIIAPPAIVTFIFSVLASSTGPTFYFYSSVVALASLILWPQYLAIGFTLFHSHELLVFYKKLAKKRNSANARGGLVDSYKHLREHGNSFSIVVLEIILGTLLFAAGTFGTNSSVTTTIATSAKVVPYIGIILLWILPAALVWLVGTLLEKRFAEDVGATPTSAT